MKLPELCAITSKKVGLAVGRRVSGGFAVLGGSRAAATEVPSCPAGIAALRRALAAARVLVPDGDSLAFAQDFTFASPSAAASAVLGSSANGLDEWKPMV